MNTNDLADLVLAQLHSDETVDTLAFSSISLPPALILPPEGVRLDDMVKFIEQTLDKGLGYVGVGQVLDMFFRTLPELKGVYLTRFEVDLQDDLRHAPFFVGLQLKQTSWTIIEGSGLANSAILALEAPGFTIGSTGAGATPAIDVYGTLAILGVKLLVSVSWPHKTLSGSLIGDGIKVKELLKGLGLSGENFDVTIDTLFLKADIDNKAYDFSIGFGKWAIPGIALQLSEITLDLSWFDGHTNGTLEAQITLAGVDVDLRALYQDGALNFSGSTGPDQKIPIGDLLIDLGEKFGIQPDHPASLERLVFKNLSVSFDTATKDFTFKGEAEIEVDGTMVLIEVSIAISHQSDGLAHKRFSGIIKFGTNEFDVVFDDKKIMLEGNEVEVSALVAAYQSTTGDPPGIRDLVPTTYKNLVPDIKTRGAFLARLSKPGMDQHMESKWLLGLSLEAGLDLSNVKLPDLPLMGADGPPKSLKLDLQVLVATKKFTESDVGIIAGLNATGGLNVPGQSVENVAVATVLFMDGKTVTLNLPIRANADSQDGKTPSFVDNAPAVADADHAIAATPGVAVTPDDTKWVNVQKNFGPIHVERVGLKYKEEKLFIFLDGGLIAAGFTLSLEGLGVDTPLTKFDPHFHLSGIGIDYKGPSVELGGAFLQQEMADPDDPGNTITVYAGEAVLRTGQLSLSAIGSFFKYRGESSLFIYALLEYPLGGPPFFFVTGLAAGFGYNRRAIVPEVEQVHTYPLVTKAIAGPVPKDGAVSAAAAKSGLAAELAALEAFIPPELGEIFFAVGVKFSSFKLVDSFALIIAQFGAHNQFDLVGVSHLQIPSKEASGTSGSLLADIYMNWKAVFKPEEGLVGLKADIVQGSYVFSPDCHLSGGFAYYAWFSGEHAGDFVYTLGGYHPDFQKPDHYPVVPRLAFNWIIKEANLHLKGELYYALTGHAFMAGGKLDASIHGGFDIGIAGVDYSADVHIAADFLISWEPYHYDASVSLDLNISLSAHLLFISKEFSLNVGGNIHIWGPEFAGEAHIYLKVWKISHTLDVRFGHGPPQLRPITWDRFSTAFLPQKTEPEKGTTQPGTDKEKDKAGTPIPAELDPHAICGVSVKAGLIRTSGDYWVINAKDFSLVTDSVIPINLVCLGDTPFLCGTTHFGIAPMGIRPAELLSTHSITIKSLSGQNKEEFFRCEPVYKKVPAALWDEPKFDDPKEEFLKKPEINPDRQLVSGVLGGLEVLPAVPVHPSETLPVDRKEMQYVIDRIPNAYQWEQIPAFDAEEQEYLIRNDGMTLNVSTDGGEQLFSIDLKFIEELDAAQKPSDMLRNEFRNISLTDDTLITVQNKGKNWKIRKAGWRQVNDTILKPKEKRDTGEDEGKPWKVREAILNELGLGREEIYFGHPVDQYMLDGPQIDIGYTANV